MIRWLIPLIAIALCVGFVRMMVMGAHNKACIGLVHSEMRSLHDPETEEYIGPHDDGPPWSPYEAAADRVLWSASERIASFNLIIDGIFLLLIIAVTADAHRRSSRAA